MSQSELPDRLIKGYNYFPWDFSICPSFTAGGGNCFPTLGNCRRFWLLPPIQRDPWDVSYYQLPAPTTRAHREQRGLSRIWPRYGVSPSARISHNRLELNADVAFFKTVKKKLVNYCELKYWGFFPHLWDEKSLSSAPRHRVSRKWRAQQFPMQPPAWESRWSGEATFQLCFNEQVVCSSVSFDEWVFSFKSWRLSFITPSICSTRQDRFSTLDK